MKDDEICIRKNKRVLQVSKPTRHYALTEMSGEIIFEKAQFAIIKREIHRVPCQAFANYPASEQLTRANVPIAR